MARVRALKDGPLEIGGDIELVDEAGMASVPAENPVYLCRCGHSAEKPFCDGTHKKIGFQAPGWSRPASGA